MFTWWDKISIHGISESCNHGKFYTFQSTKYQNIQLVINNAAMLVGHSDRSYTSKPHVRVPPFDRTSYSIKVTFHSVFLMTYQCNSSAIKFRGEGVPFLPFITTVIFVKCGSRSKYRQRDLRLVLSYLAFHFNNISFICQTTRYSELTRQSRIQRIIYDIHNHRDNKLQS